jgi:DNA-binding response OmpR family regulator
LWENSALDGSVYAVELPRSIEAAIERTAGLIGDKPVTLVAEYPAHLPAIEGDQEELTHVLSSLIAQIIAITSSGEVHIGAELLAAGDIPKIQILLYGSLGNLAQGGPWALVKVTGSGSLGVGMTLENLKQEFSRSKDQPRTYRDGLSIPSCIEVVEGYGGELWVEAMAGGGVRCNVALPLRAARYGSADLSSLRRMVETSLPEHDKVTKTILLMTEEEGLQDLLANDLSQAGHRVIIAPNGANVLGLARSERPDLILLDLDARDPTGFDVATVLKQDTEARDIPVLFMTSIADPDVGIRMGAVSFVARTEGTGKLLSAIDAVLESGISPSSRLLVVESNDVTRETIIHMIQSHGYRVTEARGPEEALALTERLAPKIILINSKIAQERDYWLLRGLRNISHDTDIFVLADVLSEEEGRAAISRGASGYSQTGRLRELLDALEDRKGTHE